MARTPDGIDRAPLTVAARRVLLDAVQALDEQRNAIVLVGAQAVYLRSRDAMFSVAAYTSDGDLALDPGRLAGEPRIELLMSARFTLSDQPGMWTRQVHIGDLQVGINVDLLVPATFGGGGKRAARIPPHARNAARKVPGLEPATVDNDVMALASLEPTVDTLRGEGRRCRGAAGGQGVQIGDRLAHPVPGREADKDAGDVIRLMATSDAAAVAARFSDLLVHPTVGHVTAVGLTKLRRQFQAAQTDGTRMAVAALAGAKPGQDTIRALAAAYISALPRP